MPRRFPPPWTAERFRSGYVKEATAKFSPTWTRLAGSRAPRHGPACMPALESLPVGLHACRVLMPSMPRSLNANVAPGSRSVGLSLGCARPRPLFPATPAMSRGRKLFMRCCVHVANIACGPREGHHRLVGWRGAPDSQLAEARTPQRGKMASAYPCKPESEPRPRRLPTPRQRNKRLPL